MSSLQVGDSSYQVFTYALIQKVPSKQVGIKSSQKTKRNVALKSTSRANKKRKAESITSIEPFESVVEFEPPLSAWVDLFSWQCHPDTIRCRRFYDALENVYRRKEIDSTFDDLSSIMSFLKQMPGYIDDPNVDEKNDVITEMDLRSSPSIQGDTLFSELSDVIMGDSLMSPYKDDVSLSSEISVNFLDFDVNERNGLRNETLLHLAVRIGIENIVQCIENHPLLDPSIRDSSGDFFMNFHGISWTFWWNFRWKFSGRTVLELAQEINSPPEIMRILQLMDTTDDVTMTSHPTDMTSQDIDMTSSFVDVKREYFPGKERSRRDRMTPMRYRNNCFALIDQTMWVRIFSEISEADTYRSTKITNKKVSEWSNFPSFSEKIQKVDFTKIDFDGSSESEAEFSDKNSNSDDSDDNADKDDNADSDNPSDEPNSPPEFSTLSGKKRNVKLLKKLLLQWYNDDTQEHSSLSEFDRQKISKITGCDDVTISEKLSTVRNKVAKKNKRKILKRKNSKVSDRTSVSSNYLELFLTFPWNFAEISGTIYLRKRYEVTLREEE